MQNPGRVNHIERALSQAGAVQVGFDELYSLELETSCGRCAQPERCAREVGADHHSMSARQVQAHLSCATPDLDNARIAGNRAVDQPRELASFRARPQPA